MDSGKDCSWLLYRYNSRKAYRFPMESGKDCSWLLCRYKIRKACRFPMESGKNCSWLLCRYKTSMSKETCLLPIVILICG
jgi:hypothetical protein